MRALCLSPVAPALPGAYRKHSPCPGLCGGEAMLQRGTRDDSERIRELPWKDSRVGGEMMSCPGIREGIPKWFSRVKRVWSSGQRALFGLPADVDQLVSDSRRGCLFLTPNPPSTGCSGAGKVAAPSSTESRSERYALHVWQPVRATQRYDLTSTMSVGLCG